MPVVLLGVNHKTAPVAVRERLAFGEEGLADFLCRLKGLRSFDECAILPTCNRTELYAATAAAGVCRDDLSGFLADTRSLEPSEFTAHLYGSADHEAITHLFSV